MNPGMIIIFIMLAPFAYPLIRGRNMRVSDHHMYVGLVLCMVDAFALFLFGGWRFLASGYREKAGFAAMSVIALIVFAAGIVILRKGSRIKVRHQDIVKNGVSCTGKVFGYEEGEERIGGAPMVLLQVRYYNRAGQIRQALVPTDWTRKEKYPIGGNITLWLWNGLATTDSAEAVPAPLGESELMMGGIDVYGTQPRQGQHCPNCGAIVNVPLFMSAKCPYCGHIISYEAPEEPGEEE